MDYVVNYQFETKWCNKLRILAQKENIQWNSVS